MRERAEWLVRYRCYRKPEGSDGLDCVRHNLRVLRAANLPETRLIICSTEGDSMYPDIDRTAGREGRVLVGFVVDEEGRVGEVRVISGVSRTLDAEAVRVVKRMPRWKPGRHGGQTVSVFYVLPINFKLGRN